MEILRSLLRKIYSHHYDLINRLRDICVTNDHGYARIHNIVFSSFMTYHRVCNSTNTTGSTSASGAETAYSSASPELNSGLREFLLLDLYLFSKSVVD